MSTNRLDSTKPRPYSRYNPATGRVEWVAPPEPGRQRRLRSRLETDDELRARFDRYDRERTRRLHGAELDAFVKREGHPPRRFLDEEY